MATAKVMRAHGAIVFGSGRNEESLQALKTEETLLGYCVADLTADNVIATKRLKHNPYLS